MKFSNLIFFSLSLGLALLIGMPALFLNSTMVLARSDGESSFEGTIGSLPTSGLVGDWLVNGVTVRVTSSTEIDQELGAAVVGARVEVKGTQQTDGSVIASKVEVKQSPGSGSGDGSYTKFYGTIESAPVGGGQIGLWTIHGRTVRSTIETEFDLEHGLSAVGAYVEVEGIELADNSILASRIEVKQGTLGSSGTSYTEFYGTISSLPATTGFVGNWTVSGKAVRVTTATTIEQRNGVPVVGRIVQVKGTLQPDGVTVATRIEVKSNSGTGDDRYSKFYGLIQTLPSSSNLVGTWTISGRIVLVTTATFIDREHGPAVIGAYVEVEGRLQTDGSLLVTRIEIKQKAATAGRLAKFFGIVESFPSSMVGEWKVSGRSVQVTATTRIKQKAASLAIGSNVKIQFTSGSDGSVTASKVIVLK